MENIDLSLEVLELLELQNNESIYIKHYKDFKGTKTLKKRNITESSSSEKSRLVNKQKIDRLKAKKETNDFAYKDIEYSKEYSPVLRW